MDGEIDDGAVLKYVRFQIWPDLNRYQAFSCDGHNDEFLFEGLLEQLTRHLPQVKDFYFEGCEANVQLQWPRKSSAATWFSRSTLNRFLSIANSAELCNEIKAIEDEMCQLENARKFHLSLYSQGRQHGPGSEKADGDNPNSLASESKFKSEVEIVASDPSKNELLRAMDSRLEALRHELAASFQQAAGYSCSSEDVSHMIHCCQNLGAMTLKKYLIKYAELSQIRLTLDNPTDEKPTFINAVGWDDENKTGANRTISHLDQPEVSLQCNSSPAKVAQPERDDTTYDMDSSDGNDVDATERSRSLARSATPRRSASPMRRVQIARVGSRRAAAIGIKSLNYFPVREKTMNRTDEPANSSDGEVSEKPLRKPETNVQRMSVQAAISLFESKQREENADIQKKSSGDMPENEKPVLRKWNSCIEQTHVQCSAEGITENHSFSSAADLQDTGTPEVERQEPALDNTNITNKAGEYDAILQTPDSFEPSALKTLGSTAATQEEESTEGLTASAKWSQLKEAELNVLMKTIEGKPGKHKSPDTKRNNIGDRRGGFYDDYKKKRDEKLRGENAAKRAEKEAQLKAMQQIVDKSKVDMPSKDSRRQSLRKSLPSATAPQSVNPKKDVPKDTKHTTAKRGAVKPSSSLPATRKSWPSSPLPQEAGTSPLTNSSTRAASLTVMATRRKSQTPQSLARANPKVEKPLLQKNAKGLQSEARTSSKGAMVTQHQPGARDNKTKPKSVASSEDFSDMVPAKTGLPTKGARKSSVVPVESKPFLRKGSKVGAVVVPASTKTKALPQSTESVRKSGNTPCSLKKAVAVQSPEQVDKHEIEKPIHGHAEPALVSEILLNSDQKYMDPATPCKGDANGSADLGVADDFSLTMEKEETTISPSAWVEIEESHDLPIMPIPIDDSEIQFAYPLSIASAETGSPRMRQSLSQMLLQESKGLVNNTEWGTAEHPHVFYQKDSPKGFKRLLKFARKSKGDGNSSGWSSPSVFSEGDDDADDYKTAFPKNTDNRLRKGAYHTTSTGQLKSLLSEGKNRKDTLHKHKNENSSGAQRSSYQMGEGHNPLGISGIKPSRSFFSLSAFRGSK
uniref:COP1-interacting protein 7 n=1 Tax=Kalanchoe fedtschenkoi TaxID=63787 RepID=A0A7N0UF93_KALFE